VRKKILIADDSSVVREILREFLEDRGYVRVCGEAANGFQAIETAKKARPDMVLLDLSMPEMNGAEAASLLKKLMPDVRIVVFTMFSDDLRNSLASALGVDLVLSKPEGFRGLIEAIDSLS
jgi:DNA-binding NarL/FixJ family response regulator